MKFGFRLKADSVHGCRVKSKAIGLKRERIMGLENPSVVDAVSTAKDNSIISLSIIDGWDWSDEPKHLLALQSKLNSYFDFIQSGQIYESYPAAVSRPVTIQLLLKYPLPKKAEKFVDIARTAAAQLGVQISSSVLKGVGQAAFHP